VVNRKNCFLKHAMIYEHFLHNHLWGKLHLRLSAFLYGNPYLGFEIESEFDDQVMCVGFFEFCIGTKLNKREFTIKMKILKEESLMYF
jgi:hypothetical protein